MVILFLAAEPRGTLHGKVAADATGMVAIKKKKGDGLLLVALAVGGCCVLGIDAGHEVEQFLLVFVADGGLVVLVVVILEEHGEHVGYGLALRVAHSIDGGVGALGEQLVF